MLWCGPPWLNERSGVGLHGLNTRPGLLEESAGAAGYRHLAGLCPLKDPWGQPVKGPSERGSLWTHGGAVLGKPGWCCRAVLLGRSPRWWSRWVQLHFSSLLQCNSRA